MELYLEYNLESAANTIHLFNEPFGSFDGIGAEDSLATKRAGIQGRTTRHRSN
jgi:hypothetical protein